jgi:Kef-type K+ transport system membrane component KefB
MQLLTSLLLLIIVARLLGHLFARWGQPSIVGEMLAGVLLGPSVFNLIQPNEALSGIAQLAVFLVVLSAGIEMDFQRVVAAMRGRGLLVATLGFMLPFGGGVVVAWAYALDPMRTVFMGLCIAITALPVAARMMSDMGMIDTPIARYAIATAILNDVVALFILGVVLALPPDSGARDLLTSGLTACLKLMGLLALVIGANLLIRRLERRGANLSSVSERLTGAFGSEALFSMVVVFVLFFGMVSENLGFHFVIGAFFGALLLDRRQLSPERFEDLKRTLASVTAGFLSPIFFADLGLDFTFRAFGQLDFVVIVLLVSIATKLVAGWWGGRILGMPHREALGLGAVLNGRGVMELVVATIAYDRGFIGPTMFSVLVLMGVVTTVLSPILLNAALNRQARADYAQRHRTDSPPRG